MTASLGAAEVWFTSTEYARIFPNADSESRSRVAAVS